MITLSRSIPEGYYIRMTYLLPIPFTSDVERRVIYACCNNDVAYWSNDNYEAIFLDTEDEIKEWFEKHKDVLLHDMDETTLRSTANIKIMKIESSRMEDIDF